MLKLIKSVLFAAPLFLFSSAVLADSYRYMHVTINTPWLIFLGLLVAVLLPFILMAVLYWRTAMQRNAEDDAKQDEA